MKPHIFSGARAILTFNGNLVVYATEVSYTIETENRPLYTIDNSLPEELVPGRIIVQVTCSKLRAPLDSASVEGIQPTVLNNLTQPYTTIQLRDRATDQVILFIPQAQMIRRSGRVGAKDLATETWTFSGLAYQDEMEPKKAI
jgi:hypothetical protein